MFKSILKKIYNKKKSFKSGKLHSIFTILGVRIKVCIGVENSLHVNKYLQNINPYKVVSHKIWDVEHQHRSKILKLDWNEATIPPSPRVKERIIALCAENDFFNLYPRTVNKKLLALLARYVQLPEENIQYFASSDSVHEYIAKMYIAENDKVLIQAPSYDNFRLTVQANGGKVHYSYVDENFKFDASKFENDINKIKPSFVYICSPNNPCGFQHSEEYIEYLLAKYPEIMFLVDEAYCEFSHKSVKNLVLKYENLLVTRTMSKAFALANFRFGYLLASRANIESINAIRNPKNVTTFSQEAVTAALTDIQYMENYVDEVTKARHFFINELQKYSKHITVFDSCANFVLVKCRSYAMKANLFKYLQQNDIFVRDLSQCPQLYPCVRITIGTLDQMSRVLSVIDSFFKEEENPTLSKCNHKIALFDFCGTVVSCQTGNAYIDYVTENNLTITRRLRLLKSKILIKLGKKFIKNFYDKKFILNRIKGLSFEIMDKCALNFYVEKVRPNFIPEIVDEIERLKQEGYRIYVVSGGYDMYLKYFVEEFNLDGLFCTKIKFKNGKCLADFDGLDCMFENKAHIIKEYFKDEPFEEYETVAYTDSDSDIPMLDLCKKSVVISENKPLDWAKHRNFEQIIYTK